MINDPAVAALVAVGAAGLFAGLVGGVVAGAKNLFGMMLLGGVGAITFAAVGRVTGAPTILSAGAGFSYIYGGVGGLLFSYVVGRNDRP